MKFQVSEEMDANTLELWNVRNLEKPPVFTYKVETCQCNISVKLFRKSVLKGYEFFSSLDHLDEDAAVLSRLIYRMKMKFRHSKDFKLLKKANDVLRNYLEIDITKALKSLLELIPTKCKGQYTYLPTKNTLDYILVRLQGLAKLMCRLVETTSIAVNHLQDRISTGNFWNLAVLMLGLVARLHVLAKNIAINTCELYKKLRPFAKKLKNTNDNWLPEAYKFPKDLKVWLNQPWLNDSMVPVIDETNKNERNTVTLEDSDYLSE